MEDGEGIGEKCTHTTAHDGGSLKTAITQSERLLRPDLLDSKEGAAGSSVQLSVALYSGRKQMIS